MCTTLFVVIQFVIERRSVNSLDRRGRKDIFMRFKWTERVVSKKTTRFSLSRVQQSMTRHRKSSTSTVHSAKFVIASYNPVFWSYSGTPVELQYSGRTPVLRSVLRSVLRYSDRYSGHFLVTECSSELSLIYFIWSHDKSKTLTDPEYAFSALVKPVVSVFITPIICKLNQQASGYVSTKKRIKTRFYRF